MHEMEHGPDGLLWEILELRSYAAAKSRIESAKDKTDIKPGGMTEMVADVIAAIIKERMERKRGG